MEPGQVAMGGRARGYVTKERVFIVLSQHTSGQGSGVGRNT